MGTKNRTREYVGGYGLVGAEFWVGLVLVLEDLWVGFVMFWGNIVGWGEKICCDWAKL